MAHRDKSGCAQRPNGEEPKPEPIVSPVARQQLLEVTRHMHPAVRAVVGEQPAVADMTRHVAGIEALIGVLDKNTCGWR